MGGDIENMMWCGAGKAHESYQLNYRLLVPIAHRVRVDFTEFYASCNLFSHIKHV